MFLWLNFLERAKSISADQNEIELNQKEMEIIIAQLQESIEFDHGTKGRNTKQGNEFQEIERGILFNIQQCQNKLDSKPVIYKENNYFLEELKKEQPHRLFRS